MPSKSDIAIEENIKKQHTIDTFFKQVYIRKADHAIIADSPEEFLKQIYDPCHIWQGQQSNGYGRFTVYSTKLGKKYTTRAHRFAYALAYGFDALPEGVESGDRLVLNHLCHNRLCVNPEHLEVITNNENLSPLKRKPKYV